MSYTYTYHREGPSLLLIVGPVAISSPRGSTEMLRIIHIHLVSWWRAWFLHVSTMEIVHGRSGRHYAFSRHFRDVSQELPGSHWSWILVALKTASRSSSSWLGNCLIRGVACFYIQSLPCCHVHLVLQSPRLLLHLRVRILCSATSSLRTFGLPGLILVSLPQE